MTDEFEITRAASTEEPCAVSSSGDRKRPGVGVSVLDAPRIVAADGSALLAINFTAPWRDSPLLAELGGALKGCRVVGVVTCQLGAHAGDARGPRREGLLLRHISSKTFRLAGAFGVIALDTRATDDFLAYIRHGHHGGPGRCQGTLTRDGFSYPRSHSVTLPTATIRWATRHGRGVFSQGLRRLAAQAAQVMLDEDGQLCVECGDPLPPASRRDMPAERKQQAMRAYLDHESVARLRAIGRGNLSAGIRAAQHWMVHSGQGSVRG